MCGRFVGNLLKGQTVGVIGAGRIGSAYARMMVNLPTLYLKHCCIGLCVFGLTQNLKSVKGYTFEKICLFFRNVSDAFYNFALVSLTLLFNFNRLKVSR